MKRILISSIAALALMVPPASAAQIKAGSAPDVSGPLNQAQRDCQKQERENDGDVVARVKLCTRLYLFDNDSETDEDRRYGVMWLQMTGKSVEGWCSTQSKLFVSLRNGRLHDGTPDHRIEQENRRERVARLKVDAQGTATQVARIRQEFILYPGVYKPIRRTEDGDKLFIARWRGSTGRRIGFAVGVEFSWPNNGPNPRLNPGLDYQVAQRAAC